MWPFTRKLKGKPAISSEEAQRLLEDGKRRTGLSESQLERMFMEHLIEEGKNPFKDLPEQVSRQVMARYPELVNLARQKFGWSPHDASGNDVPPPDLIAKLKSQPPPSMVMSQVPGRFSYPDLVQALSRTSLDKQIVCVINIGCSSTEQDFLQNLLHLTEFGRDPKLVVMRLLSSSPMDEQLVIRATFMRETAHEVQQTNLADLAKRLSEVALSRSLHVKTITF